MADIEQLITTAMDGGSADHAGAIIGQLDIWSSAIKAKAGVGRGSSKKKELYGIKKLRELILELAVRGLLVPQDPNDEPASELLKKIAVEKQQLIKDKKIKKQKPLPLISDEDMAFKQPRGWKWARLGEVGLVASSSRVHKRDWQDNGIPFFRAREIVKLSQHGRVENELFISAELFHKLTEKGVIPELGDVMITGVGTIGVPYTVKESESFYFKDASVLIFKNYFNLYPPYLTLFMKSPCWNKSIHEGSMGTTVHTLTISRANIVSVPIPPLAEQHRIVAKVDELMALCDQLEQQTETSLTAHQTLVETVLAALTRPTAPNGGSKKSTALQTAGSSAKPATLSPEAILFEHFDTLFTTQHSIDQLKQTILKLAVMGKLAPQNPNDEPASELLKKIAAEKEQLIKDKKIKKQKPLPPISDEEKPFELPVGWEWCRLSEVIQISSGGGLTSVNMNKEGGVPVYGGNGVTGFHDVGNIDHETLVIGRVGFYCGSIHITPNIAWVTDNAFITKFSEKNIDLNYLAWLLKGTDLKENQNATAQPVISGRKIYPIIVAIPPQVEQIRIVDRIDSLYQLCDQLKAHLNDAQTTQLHLADALAGQAIP